MSVLAITMEEQAADQWCWAAVTSSACESVNNHSISQEAIVCQVLANSNCGTKPVPQECDIPVSLENSLKEICNCGVDIEGVLAFEEIQNQIDIIGRPVAIGIKFTVPGQSVMHYCLVKGCDAVDGNREVIVLDPAHNGESHMSYESLKDGSVLGAPWLESFILL